MSSAQTQTRGSEAKHIGLPTHARQQEIAQGNPCASYRVKKQTVLAKPNPLPAEQAESVSSDFRKRHVFADLCKDFRQIPASAASQRQIGP